MLADAFASAHRALDAIEMREKTVPTQMFASESPKPLWVGYEDAMTFPRRFYELFMTLLVQAVPDLLV